MKNNVKTRIKVELVLEHSLIRKKEVCVIFHQSLFSNIPGVRENFVEN